MIRLYLWFCRVLFLLHAGHGCGGHPACPAPPVFSRASFSRQLGRESGPRQWTCVREAFQNVASNSCSSLSSVRKLPVLARPRACPHTPIGLALAGDLPLVDPTIIGSE